MADCHLIIGRGLTCPPGWPQTAVSELNDDGWRLLATGAQSSMPMTRWLSPEEQELGDELKQLAQLEAKLAQRELDLATLHTRLRRFEEPSPRQPHRVSPPPGGAPRATWVTERELLMGQVADGRVVHQRRRRQFGRRERHISDDSRPWAVATYGAESAMPVAHQLQVPAPASA